MPPIRSLATLVLLALAGAVQAQPEFTRREYFSPGLVVETGARRGACDVLLFSDDGTHLMAAGDDKAVRCWKVGPEMSLSPADVPALRWRTWHETRGNIYAFALSPDKENRLVAVGGQGMTPGALAVIDRRDGSILHAFPWEKAELTEAKTIRHGTVWAMDFSPVGGQVAYGAQDGSVWTWDLRGGEKTLPRQLGKHERPSGKEAPAGTSDLVRLVKYLDAGRVLSVSADGEVVAWRQPTSGKDVSRATLFRFTMPALYRVSVSPDGRWLAAAGEAPGKSHVELRSLPDGAGTRELRLPRGELPHSLAFSADGRRLAVGVRVVAQPKPGAGNLFFKETANKIYLYDLTKGAPQPVEGPAPTYHPEAIAFHPGGRHLAVAGGDDHEVTLWDLQTGKKTGEVRGPGSGLWAVALSPDARYLGLQSERNRDPAHPNDRGAGPWRVFDLHERRWADGVDLKAAPNRDAEGGWRLRTSVTDAEGEKHGIPPGDRRNAYVWFVEDPTGKLHRLPLFPLRDKLPRCYAFLPAGAGRPVRLLVGHLWGVSVFDLTPEGPRRSRLMMGHEGEVMALAVSADGSRLVTASRDQTVSGWTLDDWKNHPELGARFGLREGRLVVTAVEDGSPAWDLGLSKDDEVVLLARTRDGERPQLLFNRGVAHYGKDTGTVAAAKAALDDARAGEELYFGWRRAGVSRIIEGSTNVRQRPLWRFFPTRDGDWVLWGWRDHYYDASTNGDYLIGWLRSHSDPLRKPDFYRAEQFRREFHRPGLVAEMLGGWKDPGRSATYLSFEPPAVTLVPSAERVKDGELSVTLTAAPGGTGENRKVARVLLWVNDYLLGEWEAAGAVDPAGVFTRKEVIPRSVLRAGVNFLTLQAYNHAGVRGEATPRRVLHDRPPLPPTLHGVFIGVTDYGKARPKLPGLRAAEDAQAMYRLWQRRAAPLYTKVDLTAPLLDGEVTRKNILARLADLQGKVGPDDRLVLHLGGHGARPQDLRKALRLSEKDVADLDSFLFCCADFDRDRLHDTTVGFAELYRRLVKLPCHKIVLLDTCHAGDVRSGVESTVSNPIRILTRDGVGPIILAACEPHQSAYEEEALDFGRAYGLFTIGVRRALEEAFTKADANRNGALEPGELFAQVTAQVQGLVERMRRIKRLTDSDRQDPMAFLPAMAADLPLVRRAPDK